MLFDIYLNIILLVSSSRFYAYNIMSCDLLCNHGYMPLNFPKEKEKEKLN